MTSPTPHPHKSWHSRGYLPHCDVPNLIQSITFRLADSLPSEVLDRLISEEPREHVLREKIEALLDAGQGSCWLAHKELAQLVEKALFHFDGIRYRLIAWCIMPNHVHTLIELQQGHPLGDVVQGWKSFTAKEMNRILKRSGRAWGADYFDRYIRDDRHLRAAIDYIENNPVKAGWVEEKEDWLFSSATKQAGGTRALPGKTLRS